MPTPAPRLEYAEFRSLAPGVAKGLVAASTSANADLPLELLELVRQRASLENGCHFCIAMHLERLRHAGVSEERIVALGHWREATCFSARERAAFALTDAATRLPAAGVPADVFETAAAHFSPKELGALVSAIAIINAWNRIAVTFEFSPESGVSAAR
jgi:AhpD family alkylhydroperoxidase